MGIFDIIFGMDDDKLKKTYEKAVIDAKGMFRKQRKTLM